MNKRLLLTLMIVFVVLMALAVWKSNRSSAAIQQNHPPSLQFTPSNAANDNDIKQHKNKDEAFQNNILEQLQALQKQPGNITLFLNQFRMNCPVTV